MTTQPAFTCSKLVIETLGQCGCDYVQSIQRHWRCSDIVNFEHISHLVLVFLLLSSGETRKTNQKFEVFN